MGTTCGCVQEAENNEVVIKATTGQSVKTVDNLKQLNASESFTGKLSTLASKMTN